MPKNRELRTTVADRGGSRNQDNVSWWVEQWDVSRSRANPDKWVWRSGGRTNTVKKAEDAALASCEKYRRTGRF